MVKIDEGTPVVPPQILAEDLRAVSRAFFGNLYDVHQDNRTKNRLLCLLGLALAVVGAAFTVYVLTHNEVEVRVVNSQLAEDVPFRVLSFDESLAQNEALVFHFLGRLTENLFSHDKDALIANREYAMSFLSGPRIRALEAQTNALIAEFQQRGRFLDGNPQARPTNFHYLQHRPVHKVQVFAELLWRDDQGETLREATYLITFVFRLSPGTERLDAIRNPLGIRVTAWHTQRQQGEP